MKLTDAIRNIFRTSRSTSIVRVDGWVGSFERYDFAGLVWLNICDLLTDLVNDVTLVRKTGDIEAFAAFKSFVEIWGKVVLQKLFDEGFVVVGYRNGRLMVLNSNEYRRHTNHNVETFTAIDPDTEIYVMRSTTFITRKVSDRTMCKAWLDYLDDVMSGSANIAKRLGVELVVSPKTASASPVSVVLTDEQKKELESDLQKDYGMLKHQNSVMILPRDMNFNVVNLAGQDVKMTEKCRHAILAICDRIKVPANQVAIIDANSSKSLSNGSELREGDRNKYQSFERLFTQTFMQMATDMGLSVDYTIYNKPQSNETII